jgi:arylsulfatase A-like enzyme
MIEELKGRIPALRADCQKMPFEDAARCIGHWSLPGNIYPPRAGKPDYMQHVNVWKPGPDGEPVLRETNLGNEVSDKAEGAGDRTLSDWVRQYNQAVRTLDEGIGQVLATLEESGQLANTLVVLTSDQGYAWGQHGFRAKLAPYDANIRSPLIVSMPGTLPEGKICHVPVCGADLAPTFFHFAGLELPWAMHGHDLTPLLQQPDAEWPHPALLVFTGDKFVPKPEGTGDSRDSRQLPDSCQPCRASCVDRMGRADQASLPATLLSQ